MTPPTPHPYTHRDGSVVWRVRFRTDFGQAVESFDGPEAAWDFARQVDSIGGTLARRARDAMMVPGATGRTLAAALEHHLEVLSASVTPGTIHGYRTMAQRTWLPVLGALPVAAITEDDVARWVAVQRDKPARAGGTYSTKSLQNAKALLSGVLAREVRDRHIPSNPAAEVRLPRDKVRRKEPIFLTPGQFAAILACVRPEWQPFVSLLAGTGLRWGEATALTAADFDLTARPATVRVVRAWKTGADGGVYLGTPKTRRSRRTVSLPESLVPDLRERLARLNPGDMVFPAKHGGPMRTAWFHTWVWGPACKASGTGLRPRVHDLRHSHGSWLTEQGMPMLVVQRRLGHESITTTMDIYGHLSPDAWAGAADAIDRALTTALPQLEP